MAPQLAAVGHDDGRLVFRFERLVPRHAFPPGALEWSSALGMVRWEIEHAGEGALLTFVAEVDADDPDLAAATGTSLHAAFELLTQGVDGSQPGSLPWCADLGELTRDYAAAVAAALADTD